MRTAGVTSDMINLISTQAGASSVTGPQKVFHNLTKGLDAIGYPYVVNRSLESTRRLWIHDDTVALSHAARSNACTVAGPNLYVMPADMPDGLDLSGMLYIHPSQWVIDLWREVDFRACDLASWPVGIDLERFRPATAQHGRPKVLVYHKLRPPEELQVILRSLEDAQLDHRVMEYGSYREEDFVTALKSASVVVWHGRHESQGIALEETLAADVPVLVCDVTQLSQETGSHFPPELDSVKVTAAPYFDATCGRRTLELDQVGRITREMLDHPAAFAPREFVRTHLSLEGQARAFVELWTHFGLTVDEGYRERPATSKPWRPPQARRPVRPRDIGRRLKSAARRALARAARETGRS